MYASLIPGLILGLIGLYIIFWFARLILSQFSVPLNLRNLKARKLMSSNQSARNKVIELIKQEKYPEALEQMKACFIFRVEAFPSELIEDITDNHMQVLGLMLDISERLSIRLEELPILEELIQVRGGMLKAYADTVWSLKKVQTKGDQANWAKHEFVSKEKDLLEKMNDNMQAIKKTFTRLVEAMLPVEDRHDYH